MKKYLLTSSQLMEHDYESNMVMTLKNELFVIGFFVYPFLSFSFILYGFVLFCEILCGGA